MTLIEKVIAQAVDTLAQRDDRIHRLENIETKQKHVEATRRRFDGHVHRFTRVEEDVVLTPITNYHLYREDLDGSEIMLIPLDDDVRGTGKTATIETVENGGAPVRLDDGTELYGRNPPRMVWTAKKPTGFSVSEEYYVYVINPR